MGGSQALCRRLADRGGQGVLHGEAMVRQMPRVKGLNESDG